MALTDQRVEARKQAMLRDPEFMTKLRSVLANVKPEQEFGSYQHRELVAMSVECRAQVKLREDLEALAECAWFLLEHVLPGSTAEFDAEQTEIYETLKDYFEVEEDDADDPDTSSAGSD